MAEFTAHNTRLQGPNIFTFAQSIARKLVRNEIILQGYLDGKPLTHESENSDQCLSSIVMSKTSLQVVAMKMTTISRELSRYADLIQDHPASEDESGQLLIRIQEPDDSLDISDPGEILYGSVETRNLQAAVRGANNTDMGSRDHMKETMDQNIKLVKSKKGNDDKDNECAICQEPYFSSSSREVPINVSTCGHQFGDICFSTWCDVNDLDMKQANCPLCRGTLQQDRVVERLRQALQAEMEALRPQSNCLTHQERMIIAYSRVRHNAKNGAKAAAWAIQILEKFRGLGIQGATIQAGVQDDLASEVQTYLLMAIHKTEDYLRPCSQLCDLIPPQGEETRYIRGQEVIAPEFPSLDHERMSRQQRRVRDV